METFWQYRQQGVFDKPVNLLATLGYAPEIVAYSLDPDSYYVPNERSGRLVTPAGVSSDKIPVIALELGTKREFDRPVLHYLQRTALRGAGYTAHDVTKVERRLGHGAFKVTGSGGGHGTASIFARITDMPRTTKQVKSRPMLIFNVDPLQLPSDPICGGVVLHELVHVVQDLSDPFYEPSLNLKNELEAYAVEARLITEWAFPYSTAIAMAGTVDTARKRYLGETNFVPTDFFVDAIKHDPILSRIA